MTEDMWCIKQSCEAYTRSGLQLIMMLNMITTNLYQMFRTLSNFSFVFVNLPKPWLPMNLSLEPRLSARSCTTQEWQSKARFRKEMGALTFVAWTEYMLLYHAGVAVQEKTHNTNFFLLVECFS